MPRAMLLVAVGAAVNSFGMGFFWPLTAIYVHQALGQSMTLAGAVLTVQAGAGLVGSALGGTLFDRYGGRLPLLASAAASVLALVCVAADGSLWVYAAAAAVLGMDVGVVFTCLNALAPQAWPGGGRDAFNAVYVAFNVGVALGPVAAGLVAGVGFRWTFLAAAALLAGLFLLVLRSYRGPAFARVAGAARRLAGATGRRGLGTGPRGRGTRPRGLGVGPRGLAALGPATLLLAAGLALDWVGYAQWLTTTPNFMAAQGLALPLYSLLWTLNGTLILLGQPLLLRVVRWMPAVRAQIMTGSALFVAEFALLALGQAYAVYVAAMVLSTLGEMLVWPAVPAAADRSTPPGRRGAVQGVVTMAGFLGRMVGPLLGGALFAAGPSAVFVVMAAAAALAGVIYLAHDRLGVAAPAVT